MWYRLNSAVTSSLNITVPLKENGFTKFKSIKFEPNKEYEYPDYLDAILTGYTKHTKYTKERETALKDAKARYEVKLCKVCGGKRTDLIYHPIEKVE